MGKRYEFVDFTANVDVDGESYKVHRIRSLIDMPEHGVKAGDLGGFISREENLPLSERSWVFSPGVICGRALVRNTSSVSQNAIVSGHAVISGESKIKGRAQIKDHAQIIDSTIRTDVVVSGTSTVTRTTIGGDTNVLENVFISDSSIVTKNTVISGNVVIDYSSIKVDESTISGSAKIINSNVGMGQRYDSHITIRENALIKHVLCISGKHILIEGQAQLLSNVTINGHDITIKGMSVVKGHVRIGLKTVIDEYATLEGSEKKPKFYESFSGKTLIGDDHYVFE